MDDEHAPLMIAAALDELRGLAGLEGVATIDRHDPSRPATVVYSVGSGVEEVLATVRGIGWRRDGKTFVGATADGRPLMVCPWILPPARNGALALWRAPGAPAWRKQDQVLGTAATGLIRVMLEFGPDEAGIDRATGLPNRLYFLDEADRHIERLMQDKMPGTLLVVVVDHLEQLIATHGRDVGHWAMARMAALIRSMVRPTDLVARIGRDEFAVWMNAVDQLTAAERAEALRSRRLTLPEAPGRGVVALPSLSIGIASHEATADSDIRSLLYRAREALRRVRDKGGDGWYVSRTRA